MVYFKTQNPYLGKFWRATEWKILIHFIAGDAVTLWRCDAVVVDELRRGIWRQKKNFRGDPTPTHYYADTK
jgi:hypothetical protein